VDVERLAFDLLARGLNGATVERILATLSSAYTTAVAGGLVERNPVTSVRIPKHQSRALPRWNVDQAQTFLDALGNDSLDLLFRVALITGMRRGELLGLRWADVDLHEGSVRIHSGRLQVGGRIVEGELKSRHSVRTVYLDTYTLARLNWLQGRSHSAHGHVFVDAHGEPLTPGWVSYRFAKRIADLGLPGIRFHDLRHASATFGLASGESLKEVSQRLGHSDITVTANIYTDVLPATAKASAQRLARSLESVVLPPLMLRSA
jgi:integrase